MSDLKQANVERWMAICKRLGVGSEYALQLWDLLLSAYAEPSRHYHNLEHVDHMLGWLDRSGDRTDELEIAIWFHDVIYDPMATDNEAQSAALFESRMGEYLPEAFTESVIRLILATDIRRARGTQADEQLMVDIDLSILSAEPEIYQAYTEAVRREYAMVPDAKFKAGRREVLQQILSCPIYRTDLFLDREPLARRNLEIELARLV
ncbi:MAG: HD domain-containing protein [Opitutaceae bacterium]